MIADAGKRYTLVPEETIPSKAKSVKTLSSLIKRSAQLTAGFVCAIALAAGAPTVADAQVLTTDNVCGKTADVRGITAENLPDIDATNALVMGKDGTVYYGRGADEQVKIASITKVMTAILTVENCKMDEKVTVSNAAATVGNSTAGLARRRRAYRGAGTARPDDSLGQRRRHRARRICGQEDRPQDQRRRGHFCEGHERAR